MVVYWRASCALGRASSSACSRGALVGAGPSAYHYLVSARAGEGAVQAAGDLLLPKDEAWQFTSDIKGSEFLVAEGGQLMLTLSPDLHVKYSDQSTEVTGELLIPRAQITVQEMPATVTTLSSDIQVVGLTQESDAAVVNLDIKTIIEDKVQLAVLGLEAGLTGELHLINDQKSQEIKAFGQLQLNDGIYEIYGQRLHIKQGLMIFTAIPMSAIGGILALWLRGMPFSISAAVGFIALFGVAVLNGIVLVAEFNRLRKSGIDNLKEIIMQGTKTRLRPVIMTATVASLGFLPMAISMSGGAEVQRPLATVVIGGLLTATLLTLVVLPILYELVERDGNTD